MGLFVDMDGADQSVCGAQSRIVLVSFPSHEIGACSAVDHRRSFERALQCAESAAADGN